MFLISISQNSCSGGACTNTHAQIGYPLTRTGPIRSTCLELTSTTTTATAIYLTGTHRLTHTNTLHTSVLAAIQTGAEKSR